VKRAVIPDRGDLVWLDFTPQAGHEQAGRRPALVLSPAGYNRRAGLAIACPITSRSKGYPFEVELPAGLSIEGVVLSDHVRSIDWLARNIEKAGSAPDRCVAEVVGKLSALISA
jgi:mRNA interferase MazF